MVTKEVFLAYAIGDDFDEHAAPRASKKARVVAAATSETKPEPESLADVLATTPKSESLLDVLERKFESKNRYASINLPREMRPETEGF